MCIDGIDHAQRNLYDLSFFLPCSWFRLRLQVIIRPVIQEHEYKTFINAHHQPQQILLVPSTHATFFGHY